MARWLPDDDPYSVELVRGPDGGWVTVDAEDEAPFIDNSLWWDALYEEQRADRRFGITVGVFFILLVAVFAVLVACW
jgi:hypothetical protein